MEALEKCREAGKLKHIGCCNFPMDFIGEAMKYYELVSTQSLFNLNHRENEATLRECHRSIKMSVIVYGVLGRGLFSGKYGTNSEFGENDTRAKDLDFSGRRLKSNLNLLDRLRTLGEKLNKTPAQVAIRWTLDLSFVTVALVGAKTVAQIEENCGSVGWRLNKKEKESLCYAGILAEETAGEQKT
jgi:aryl-alcohol dehydrogenase-like predicted oxidoreductase